MHKLSGLIFAAALLCAGGAQAFDNHHGSGAAVDIFSQNANTPPVHVNPPPPGPQQMPTMGRVIPSDVSPQHNSGYGGVNQGNQTPLYGTGGGAGKLDPNAARSEGGGKGKVMDLTVRKAGKAITPVSGF